MMQNPQISVLIPAYNEQNLISRAMDSINHSFAVVSWQSYEIVVCDNNSTDQTADIALAHRAKVVREPHNQIAKARNTAAKHASGDWLIFLDADSILNPDVLKVTIEALESGQVCGGGALMKFDGEIGWVARLMSAIWNWASPKIGIAAGAFIFCLREAWQEISGFDERLYVAEEASFARRLKKWGRENGMRFLIITESRVITSSRKFDCYGQWRIVLQFLLLGLPGAIRSRQMTKQWYRR